MRLIFFSLAVVSLMLATTLHAQQATLVATGNPQSPPIVWSKGKSLKGVGPELTGIVLSELNIPFTISNQGSWPQVQKKAREGRVDLLVSAYKNKERATYMTFSEPYMDSPVVMVTKKGDSFRCNCWEDMIGKKGVAGQGESFGDEFDSFIKKSLDVTFTTYERAFEMLEEDTADYLIIDLFPAIIYSKLLMVEDRIEYMEKPITVQQFHLAFSKKSPYADKVPAINEKVKNLKAQGKIKNLAVAQYKEWNRTFAERRKFYTQADKEARDAQTDFNAGARDRGLDNLARFIEGDVPSLDEPAF